MFFYFYSFQNAMYSSDYTAEVSHDNLEIILICWFGS